MAYSGTATKPLTAQLHLRGGVQAMTLAGHHTLTLKSANYIRFDAGGTSRNITLPAVALSSGCCFRIFNGSGGAHDLVVKDEDAATILSIPQNTSALVGCTGDAWVVLD
tara:strand:- start:1702 stop:2028 length:327 start_codon:yes stop_codon:yes gene_type:complete